MWSGTTDVVLIFNTTYWQSSFTFLWVAPIFWCLQRTGLNCGPLLLWVNIYLYYLFVVFICYRQWNRDQYGQPKIQISGNLKKKKTWTKNRWNKTNSWSLTDIRRSTGDFWETLIFVIKTASRDWKLENSEYFCWPWVVRVTLFV